MNIYLICPVREAQSHWLNRFKAYVFNLEADGHTVHFPPRDVNQNDPTGATICAAHLEAMRRADEVHVFWDVSSYGSHFDLGMAYSMGKRIVGADCLHEDRPGKSYWKAVIAPAEQA